MRRRRAICARPRRSARSGSAANVSSRRAVVEQIEPLAADQPDMRIARRPPRRGRRRPGRSRRIAACRHRAARRRPRDCRHCGSARPRRHSAIRNSALPGTGLPSVKKATGSKPPMASPVCQSTTSRSVVAARQRGRAGQQRQQDAQGRANGREAARNSLPLLPCCGHSFGEGSADSDAMLSRDLAAAREQGVKRGHSHEFAPHGSPSSHCCSPDRFWPSIAA